MYLSAKLEHKSLPMFCFYGRLGAHHAKIGCVIPTPLLLYRVCALLAALVLLGGCAGGIQRQDGRRTQQDYHLAKLAKSDVDMITEMTQREVLASLRQLAEKLYRRNPQEYRKAGLASPEAAAARIFQDVDKGPQGPLAFIDWREGLKQAFQEGFTGDRVHAFMQALTAMIMATYDYKTVFYLTDSLNAQKLYNSARNIEVAVWKLSNARLANGQPMLLTNSIEGEVQNLSFEREFGKLIARQDLLALIMEDRGSRTINRILHNMASFVFLPI